MLYSGMESQKASRADLLIDHDELVVLNRLLAKATISAASGSAAQRNETAHAIAIAERIYRFRRHREDKAAQIFGDGLFADPAWDILLDLFIHNARGMKVSVSSVCLGAHTPATTALRHIAELERRGVIVRSPHPNDRRVWHASLTDEALAFVRDNLLDCENMMGTD